MSRLQKVRLQEHVEQVSRHALDSVAEGQHVNALAILNVRALRCVVPASESRDRDPAIRKRSTGVRTVLVARAQCSRLMHRHHVSEPHAQVLADNLVKTDLTLLDGFVCQHNANRVLPAQRQGRASAAAKTTASDTCIFIRKAAYTSPPFVQGICLVAIHTSRTGLQWHRLLFTLRSFTRLALLALQQHSVSAEQLQLLRTKQKTQ